MPLPPSGPDRFLQGLLRPFFLQNHPNRFQLSSKLLVVLEPPVRVMGHRPLHKLHGLVGKPWSHLLQGCNILLSLPGSPIGDFLQLYRTDTRQGMVEGRPKSIDIRPVILSGMLKHLWRNVCRRCPYFFGMHCPILHQE